MTDTNLRWIENSINLNKNSTKLIFESPEACPKANFFNVILTIKQNVWIFGIATILIGVFLAFFGAKFVIVTIFIFTCSTTILFFFLLMFQFILPAGSKPEIVWVVLGISIVIGIVVGYYTAKYKDVLLAIIVGAFTGFILGNILYNTALKFIKFSPTVIIKILFLFVLN
jgi:hypothetical protein